MGCEIIRTLYIQGIIPCGYWGPKLSEWRWRWMSSIWHIHLQIWLHHCIGGVWICPELQILKQLSLDLVQATVEAETIVKTLRDERADDKVYQALYDEAVELGASVDVLPSKPRCAGRQMHRNNVEADSLVHYWQFALYNVFVDNIVEKLEDRFIFSKTDPYSTAINSNESAQHGCGWSIDHQACVWARHQWWCILHGMQALESPLVWGTEPPSTLTTTLDALDAEFYPDISFILTVFFTIPVTTATAERSLSSMKRIKTLFPATMTDTKLSSFGPP